MGNRMIFEMNFLLEDRVRKLDEIPLGSLFHFRLIFIACLFFNDRQFATQSHGPYSPCME